MSAAEAIDDNKDAIPATTINFTLRIGLVPLAGEANGPTSKTHVQDDGTKCLSAA